jgi:hypothetical protein
VAALFVLAALGLLASADGSGAQDQPYPLLKQFQLAGTPIGIFEFDGGADVGAVLVLGEFNLKHLVPGSFAGVISSSFNGLGQVAADGSLNELESLPRPGGTQVKPNLFQLALAPHNYAPITAPGTLSFPEVGVTIELQKLSTGSFVAATFPLNRPGDLNGFQLYFNPLLPMGQAHTHELQFVIGNDRQLHLQPSLTPGLDGFAKDSGQALKAEDNARRAITRNPKGASSALKPVNTLLARLTRGLTAAVGAGEASTQESAKPKADLVAAQRDSKQIVGLAKSVARLKLLADSRKHVQAAAAAVAKLKTLRGLGN